MMVVIVLLLAFIVVLGWAMFKRSSGEVQSPALVTSILQHDQSYYNAQNIQDIQDIQELTEASSVILMDKELDGARFALDQFIKSTSASEAANWIYNEEVDREVFGEVFEPLPNVVDIKRHEGVRYTDGSRVAVFFLSYNGGGREVQLYAAPHEEFKIDWRTFYLSGSMDFERFVSTQPEGIHDCFCYLLVDTYYSRKYRERDYQAVVLTNYNRDYEIVGYIKRDSSMDDAIANAMLASQLKLKNKTTIRVSLSLKITQRSPVVTCEIVDVLDTRWREHLVH